MVGITAKLIHKARKALKGKVKKNSTPIKWGIIGTGYMAETFSSAIDGNTDGIVAAVASRSMNNAKAFARKHGSCRAYGNYEEMVTDNTLDVIYIATPTKYHFEHIKLCLEAGKNVLCEKPITSTASELMELQRIAKEKECFLMEGMWMKCLPTYQKAIEWIQNGRIGAVDLIKVDFYKREIINPSKAIFNVNMGGGVLKDYGVYAVAFPTGFMDSEISLEWNYRKSSYGIDSDWFIRMNDGKIQAFVNISSDFAGSSKAAIMGTEGTIEWGIPFNRTNVITLYDAAGKSIDQYRVSYDFEGFEYEVNEVQKCIRNRILESVKVPIESSLNVMNIMDKLLKSEEE